MAEAQQILPRMLGFARIFSVLPSARRAQHQPTEELHFSLTLAPMGLRPPRHLLGPVLRFHLLGDDAGEAV